MAICVSIGNVLYRIPLIPKLATVFRLAGDYDTARAVYDCGLDWSQKSGMKGLQAQCLVGIARIQDAIRVFDAEAWTSALHASRQAGEKQLVMECEVRLRMG